MDVVSMDLAITIIKSLQWFISFNYILTIKKYNTKVFFSCIAISAVASKKADAYALYLMLAYCYIVLLLYIWFHLKPFIATCKAVMSEPEKDGKNIDKEG